MKTKKSTTQPPRGDNGFDLPAALGQAIGLLRSEQLPEAEAALGRILTRLPDQHDALHFLGVVRFLQGRADEAIATIRRAIEILPTEPGPWNNLGNILVESRRLDEAMEAYRNSVTMAKGLPASAEPLSNIGTIHRKRQEWVQAEQSYREALAARPDFVDAWYNLSCALMSQGRIKEGLLANSRAITLAPRELQQRDQVIRALLLQGEHAQAIQLYREWLMDEPDNPVVQHQLAACLGEAAPERASDAYVEKVFDSFAHSFDSKLEVLNYRAPQLVTDALQRSAGEPRATLDICDAGCGTGLCGPLLRPWARHLVGCDLSTGMLRQARPRGCYDALHKAELMYYLDTQPAAFDAVVSADTLCYFGALERVAAAAMRSLRPGGWLVFTVEALADDAAQQHCLQHHGRYAHRGTYLQQVLADAGFTDIGRVREPLRSEFGEPVPGWLVSARRAAATAP